MYSIDVRTLHWGCTSCVLPNGVKVSQGGIGLVGCSVIGCVHGV